MTGSGSLRSGRRGIWSRTWSSETAVAARSRRACSLTGACCLSAARLWRALTTSCRSAREASIDRKSTRLNSSHANISYAVFCLKKKKKYNEERIDDISLEDSELIETEMRVLME